jgi:hypothetical protein
MTPTPDISYRRFNCFGQQRTLGMPSVWWLPACRVRRSLGKPITICMPSGSAVFGFVDDLELHLRPEQNLIAVRSAGRLGRSDLGVNRNESRNCARYCGARL